MQRNRAGGIRRTGVIGTRTGCRPLFTPEAGFADGIHVQAVYNPPPGKRRTVCRQMGA
ncbi:MAG: hypothetical protein ACLTBV_31640 [Enterocloster bolteae]